MSNLDKIHIFLTPAERKRVGVLLVLIVAGMLLETLGIGLVIPAITLMMQGDIAGRYPEIAPVIDYFGNPSQTDLIAVAVLVLVAVYFIKNLFLAFLIWWQNSFAYDVQAHLSQRLYAIYLNQPYTFHLQRNSAQLIRNVIGEVNVFTGAMISTLMFLSELLVVLGIAALMFLVEPIGVLIVVFVFGGTAWIFNRVMREHVSRWGRERQLHDGMRIQQLQQGLGGVKEVRLLGRESDFLAHFDLHNTSSARVWKLQTSFQGFPRLIFELLAVTGLAILLLVMLGQGRDFTSIAPALGLFTVAAFRLMPSVNRLLSSIQVLRYSLPVINTLHDELRLASPVSHCKHTTGELFRNELRLRDITYSYPAATAPALQGITISIEKGEFVGLIGSSGSGKSTLVDIILGLLVPGSGQVEVDGRDIQQGLRYWQDQIGYVPQSIYLTDDTLRRNVAFGLSNEQIDDLAVRRAIKDAQLEEFVASLPAGLDTVVGERGVRLSGGQRQRIGIARALYHNPAVLVLDEATSALDGDTEREVMGAVLALKGNKTILVVAHRLSTVANCDRLLCLEAGKIVEQGKPNSVLFSPNPVAMH